MSYNTFVIFDKLSFDYHHQHKITDELFELDELERSFQSFHISKAKASFDHEDNPFLPSKMASSVSISTVIPAGLPQKLPEITLAPIAFTPLTIEEIAQMRRAPWMANGKIIEIAEPVRVKIDAKLLEKRGFDKTLRKAALLYQRNHNISHEAFQQRIVPLFGKRLQKGTCLGQSYARIVAFAKGRAIRKTDVVFFQLLELLSNRPMPREEQGKGFVIPECPDVHKLSIKALKKMSACKATPIQMFDLREKGSVERVQDVLLTEKDALVEVGLCYKRGGNHSMLSYLFEKTCTFDSQIGTCEFSSRKGFVTDIGAFIRDEKFSKDELYALTLQSFKPKHFTL